MPETVFHNRRALSIENDLIRLTVSFGGGHIAEILDKETGVNPLWVPHWPSIEPGVWSAATHAEYDNNEESALLASILGHNLCVDLFGTPSAEEYAAGVVVHGEASILAWDLKEIDGAITGFCVLPAAGLKVSRTLKLDGRRVLIEETVENLSTLDRPIAWTQHVTLGAPFLANGRTQFRMPGTRSRNLAETVEFDWPLLPLAEGGFRDLNVFPETESFGGFTTHLMDPVQARAWFTSWAPDLNVTFGYVWDRSDFPWMGIWEESNFRTHAPWLGKAKTRGMEFGASPFPETRRKMIERGSLFGEKAYRWIPARTAVTVHYYAAIAPATAIPDSLAAFESLL